MLGVGYFRSSIKSREKQDVRRKLKLKLLISFYVLLTGVACKEKEETENLLKSIGKDSCSTTKFSFRTKYVLLL